MKKNDMIIIGVALLSALVVYASLWFAQLGASTDQLVVEVYVDGTLEESIPIEQEGTFTYETKYGKNVFKIENGTAFMTEASCPQKTCITSGEISKLNENIVCLQNHLHLVVAGEGEAEVDAVSK
jgi:hypothetical protein